MGPGAPSSYLFLSPLRLQGQDQSVILAQGDLQWARRPPLLTCFSLFCLAPLLSWGKGTGSPLPPLVESPSLPTPSWIGRMDSRQKVGGGDLVPAFGWSLLKSFSCMICCLIALRTLLVLCGFLVLSCCVVPCLVYDSRARPLVCMRELGLRWWFSCPLECLASAFATSCFVCLLFVCCFFVAMRGVVVFFVLSPVLFG